MHPSPRRSGHQKGSIGAFLGGHGSQAPWDGKGRSRRQPCSPHRSNQSSVAESLPVGLFLALQASSCPFQALPHALAGGSLLAPKTSIPESGAETECSEEHTEPLTTLAMLRIWSVAHPECEPETPSSLSCHGTHCLPETLLFSAHIGFVLTTRFCKAQPLFRVQHGR